MDVQAFATTCQNEPHLMTMEKVQLLVQMYTQFLSVESCALVHVQAPVVIVGTLNGQMEAVQEIFSLVGKPPDSNFLLLGSLIPRHFLPHGTSEKNIIQVFRVMCLFICWQLLNKKRVTILRGKNELLHNLQNYARIYDLLEQGFGTDATKVFAQHLDDMFGYLPLVAVVDHELFCVHGGLDAEVNTLEKYTAISRPISFFGQDSLVCQSSLYSCDEDDVTGWQLIPRDYGYLWGSDISEEFLAKNNLTMIIRTGRFIQEGFEYRHDGSVLNVYSSMLPQVSNACSIVLVDETHSCEMYTTFTQIYHLHRLTFQLPLPKD